MSVGGGDGGGGEGHLPLRFRSVCGLDSRSARVGGEWGVDVLGSCSLLVLAPTPTPFFCLLRFCPSLSRSASFRAASTVHSCLGWLAGDAWWTSIQGAKSIYVMKRGQERGKEHLPLRFRSVCGLDRASCRIANHRRTHDAVEDVGRSHWSLRGRQRDDQISMYIVGHQMCSRLRDAPPHASDGQVALRRPLQ